MKYFESVVLGFFTLAMVGGFMEGSGRDPVGMVVQGQGKSIVSRGGQERAVQVADLLYPDDLLTVEGSLSFLFCPESRIYTVATGSALKLTADGVRAERGGEPSHREARRCSLPKVALGQESLERTGAIRVRSAGIPEIALYVGGLLSSSRPRFEWRPVDDAKSYRLTLRSESENVIWRTETDRAAADFPSDLAALNEGFYDWEVEAMLEERTIAAGRTRFEVVPDPEMAALAHEDSLLAAIDLENRGFHSEAAAIYRRIGRGSPEDGRIAHHLAWLYLQAGLIPAAEAETAPDS